MQAHRISSAIAMAAMVHGNVGVIIEEDMYRVAYQKVVSDRERCRAYDVSGPTFEHEVMDVYALCNILTNAMMDATGNNVSIVIDPNGPTPMDTGRNVRRDDYEVESGKYMDVSARTEGTGATIHNDDVDGMYMTHLTYIMTNTV